MKSPTNATITLVVAGIIWRNGHVLICRRAAGQKHALRWEFPGGKVEAGEMETAALRRELAEELDVDATIGPLYARHTHRYENAGTVELAFYTVASFNGEPRNRVFDVIRWESPQRLAAYDFLEADRPILDRLAASAS